MSDESTPQPKIIVDDDWKSQAQAEKERLAQAEAQSQAKSQGRAPGAGEGPGELPPADFQSLVGMLATQAVMYLGGVADRKTGGVIFEPDMARFYIDLLGVLEEKCKGNLTDDESRDLSGALHELRTRFVELSRAVAAQMLRQREAGGAAGSMAGPSGGGIASPGIHLD